MNFVCNAIWLFCLQRHGLFIAVLIVALSYFSGNLFLVSAAAIRRNQPDNHMLQAKHSGAWSIRWFIAAILCLISSVMAIYPMRCLRPWLLYILLLYILINKSGAISPDGTVVFGIMHMCYFNLIISYVKVAKPLQRNLWSSPFTLKEILGFFIYCELWVVQSRIWISLIWTQTWRDFSFMSRLVLWNVKFSLIRNITMRDVWWL
jgi:hypothetical protein